jgi:hypothetical protein
MLLITAVSEALCGLLGYRLLQACLPYGHLMQFLCSGPFERPTLLQRRNNRGPARGTQFAFWLGCSLGFRFRIALGCGPPLALRVADALASGGTHRSAWLLLRFRCSGGDGSVAVEQLPNLGDLVVDACFSCFETIDRSIEDLGGELTSLHITSMTPKQSAGEMLAALGSLLPRRNCGSIHKPDLAGSLTSDRMASRISHLLQWLHEILRQEPFLVNATPLQSIYTSKTTSHHLGRVQAYGVRLFHARC